MRSLEAAPLGGLLASPVPRTEAPRDLLVLHGLAAGLAAERARLRTAQAALDATGQAIAIQRATLGVEHRHAATRADAIEQDVGRAATAVSASASRQEAASRAAATAAAASASLRDAIASLRRAGGSRPAAPPGTDEAATGRSSTKGGPTKGSSTIRTPTTGGETGGATSIAAAVPGPGPRHLALPVAGPVLQRYGAPGDMGPAKGVTFGPPPGALVSAPCGGRVDFAGPFRSYGQMVILDCGGDARVVLAGLDHVDATSGAPVRRGEPVGRMPDFTPGAAPGRPTLLEQLRRGTETADPFAPLPAAHPASRTRAARHRVRVR